MVEVVVYAERPPLDTGRDAGMFGAGHQSGDTGVAEVDFQAVQGGNAHQQGERCGGCLAVADDHNPAAGMAGEDVGEAGMSASEIVSPRLAALDEWTAGSIRVVAPSASCRVPRLALAVRPWIGRAQVCPEEDRDAE
jgi:hypothetical protein